MCSAFVHFLLESTWQETLTAMGHVQYDWLADGYHFPMFDVSSISDTQIRKLAGNVPWFNIPWFKLLKLWLSHHLLFNTTTTLFIATAKHKHLGHALQLHCSHMGGYHGHLRLSELRIESVQDCVGLASY